MKKNRRKIKMKIKEAKIKKKKERRSTEEEEDNNNDDSIHLERVIWERFSCETRWDKKKKKSPKEGISHCDKIIGVFAENKMT